MSWGGVPPRIETQRFVLRPYEVDDFPGHFDMWSKIDVGVESGLKPLSREEAWAKFARGAGFWVLNGRGPLSVIDKASGCYVGDVGVSDFRRDLDPPNDGAPEFSWAVSLAHRGRGVASEAVAGMLAWAVENLSEPTFCCLIDRRNALSIRVAERNGFRPARACDYKGSACVIFERPRTLNGD